MNKTKLTRRRTIQILGAGAGLPLVGSGKSLADNIPLTEWTGQALGAKSRILLAHADQQKLRSTLARILDEIHRLENIFSLFVEDSEVSRLNRFGRIATPSLDLRLVLEEARRISDITEGAFDVTVQPLWRLFADRPAPSESQIANTLARIDYRKLTVARQQIAFDGPDMGLTLNGIAQGYITDHAADMLRSEGFDRTLVQLGETVALEPKADGQPWKMGIGEAMGSGPQMVDLANRGLATSAPRSLLLGENREVAHILDPKRGPTAAEIENVSVVANQAMTADALSTALVMVDKAKWSEVLERVGADFALFQGLDGHWMRVGPRESRE